MDRRLPLFLRNAADKIEAKALLSSPHASLSALTISDLTQSRHPMYCCLSMPRLRANSKSSGRKAKNIFGRSISQLVVP